MNEHFSYPSIGQYRNLIQVINHKAKFVGVDDNGDAIYNPLLPLPKLKLIGTTKLHGTNASIILDTNKNSLYYQSRERIIEINDDNAGFVREMSKYEDDIKKLISDSISSLNVDFNYDKIAIYGEWCGGSIQKGVALSNLPKMFVIFDVKLIDTSSNNKETYKCLWLDMNSVSIFKNDIIHNIYDYKTWEIEIDFNEPKLSQQKLIDITVEIENECPFSKQLGSIGTGEGVVFKVVSDDPKYKNSSKLWFKSKGEKHSVSKVKVLNSVDIERLSSIKEFVDYAVTKQRCEQAINVLISNNIEINNKCIGDYIRWVQNDIIKEEMDTINENKFERKELGSPISKKALHYFNEYIINNP